MTVSFSFRTVTVIVTKSNVTNPIPNFELELEIFFKMSDFSFKFLNFIIKKIQFFEPYELPVCYAIEL